MSFWREIKRRKMFQVAATYGVVAWLIAQVVAVVNGPLGLPAWFATAVIVLLALGFPITLVMSWAFNITTEGIVRDVGATAPPRVPGRRLETVLTGLLAVAVAWLVYRDLNGPHGAMEQRAPVAAAAARAAGAPRVRLPNSIAVLPFDNLSPDPGDAYFAAGLHDEILAQLAKLRSLNVIARVSVLGYPGSGKTIPQIADELNVETVMEGSIRYSRNRIRVTAQLIDAERGVHLWSETYDRELGDVFAIESDIAMNVAAALRAEFSLEEQAVIERRPTASPEAYSLYLEARKLYGEDGAAARIEQLLTQAIDLDPTFAGAFGYLAERLAISLSDASSGDGIATDAWQERERLIRTHAERALALDRANADAHAALGVLDLLSWRWAAARERFELAAGLGSIRDWAGDLEGYLDHHDEAVRIARRVVELSPNDWVAHRNLAQALLRAGQHDAAAASLRRTFELAPTRSTVHRLQAQLELARGNPAAALAETRLAEQLLGAARTRIALAQLALLYGQLGQAEDAARLAKELTDAAGDPDAFGAGNWAAAYLAVGDDERALEWLRRAAQKAADGEPDAGFLNLMLLKANTGGHPTLSRPEFAAALERIRGA